MNKYTRNGMEEKDVFYVGREAGDKIELLPSNREPWRYDKEAGAVYAAMKMNEGHEEGQPTTGGSWTVYTQMDLQKLGVLPMSRLPVPRGALEAFPRPGFPTD